MKFDLLKYMSERLYEEEERGKESGPVITISRLYGCPAQAVSELLTDRINSKLLAKGVGNPNWKYVTKEIMSESARELELDPSQIKYIFDYEQKSIIDELLVAHTSKYYKSDRKIRNTVGRVIRNMAHEGNVIIVGRGGVAITRDIPKSLHINLEAPIDWRIVRISQKYDLSLEEAHKSIIDIDKKRKQFREYFEGKNTDYTWFDLTFNCMTLSVDEIVGTIIKTCELRKLI